MNEKLHTPPPPLTVGVTGHRILTELERINAGIEEGLRRIEAAYPGRPLVLLSPLAEGADRLVADQVLRRPDARLVVPLPLTREDYQTDFQTPASQVEFEALLARAARLFTLPPVKMRNQAYEAVGRYVVDHADVLMAIWDGQDAQGQGGTGAVVARARAQGKPVVIVRAGNRKPGTQEPTSLGPQQGKVLVERLTAPPRQGSSPWFRIASTGAPADGRDWVARCLQCGADFAFDPVDGDEAPPRCEACGFAG